jgi:Fibrinogen beta and gamma chains, C-terminal globular domain
MSCQIQQAVMIGLHVAVSVGAGACLPPPGVPCGDGWCSDRELCVSLGPDIGMQQLTCVTQAIGKSCMVDADCTPGGICDTGRCRVARSCAEILLHNPGSRDGVYTIAPGTTAPFSAVCDMTRDDGGWTLLLKAQGDDTLQYHASAWTDVQLLNSTDLTTESGNAKYQSFLSLPVATLRGELDGFLYTKTFANTNKTAREIFAGKPDIVQSYPTFNAGAPNWSTQPNCQTFGVNTPYNWARARFGWSANEQNDCNSNDTAIGLGLKSEGGLLFGAGYICVQNQCSPKRTDSGGHGLLWAK